MTPSKSVEKFATLPDPGEARTLDEVIEHLRLLKNWAGDPSYEVITDRVNATWRTAGRPAGELARRGTVVDCFKTGRRRINTDLVIAVVQALHPDAGYVAQWRQALRVVGGETQAAAQVRSQNRLPDDLADFTGRGTELDRLRELLRRGADRGGTAVISAIEGMAGVGKTQLAIHAGHLLAREDRFDQVLFVNLRGFHPDPTQPPADPAAVLDGFLRLLGVPGHRIPHDLQARAAAYRDCLAGTRALVILDNAATEDQVRPLLSDAPGCLTLITSRRALSDLHSVAHLAIQEFTPDEALRFLARAAPGTPVGPDPQAPARIARRCGSLPLALGVIIGHIRATPGWTLTDHADRLDERHHDRRLDTDVELALDLSYRHLPTDRRRVLRLLALHPGQDFDAHAAAAVADTDLSTSQAHLRHLCDHYLLQQPTPGHYTFHDLIRAHAVGRAGDEDSPSERHTALTRLFDYYLAAAAAAMDTLAPGEAHRRPRIVPAATPTPDLTDLDIARAWLDTERPNLVAVAAHTATDRWPTHAIRLSSILFRYLAGGHHSEAVAIHGHARLAAQHADDPIGQANALNNLGASYMQVGRFGPAVDHLQQALVLFQQGGDLVGKARALSNLGTVERRLGRYRSAIERNKQALSLFRESGDRTGEVGMLNALGILELRLGRYRVAADYQHQALALSRQIRDRNVEAAVLHGLGNSEVLLGRYDVAADHLQSALALYRRAGRRFGEAGTLDSLGTLHTHLGQSARAVEHHRSALAIFREIGDRASEAWVLNSLGEAARVAGHTADALTHHTAAHTIATDIGDREQQVRAHEGLGRANDTLGDPVLARRHYQHALALYTDLGMPQADQIRARLDTIDSCSQHHEAGSADET